MAPYTDVSPQQVTHTTAEGIEISRIRALGDMQFAHPTDRHPAFVGLARELGGTYAENLAGMTVEDGICSAGLNYHVDLVENVDVTFVRPTGVHTVNFPASRGTVAVHTDGTMTGLGMVGRRYKRIQNTEAAELGQAIIDEGGATMVAAGAFGDPLGSRTYMAFKLPEDIVLGDREDVTNQYLTILNHHNGQGGLTALIGPIRERCTNQSSMIFRRRKNRFMFTHSGDTHSKIIDARRALEIAATWTQRYTATLQEWLNTPMGDTELNEWLTKALPTPPASAEVGVRNWAQRRLHCKEVIREWDSNEFGRGTRLAAYNGLVEVLDHGWPTRAVDRHESAIARFSRILRGGELERVKINAAELLMANS